MTAEQRAVRTRGPSRNAETRRAEIITAALQVFSASGYRAGSLKEIAGRVGLDASSLLHHFPTKEALLQAVLDERGVHEFTGSPDLDEIDPASIPHRMITLAELNDGVPEVIRLYAVLSAESTTTGHPAAEFFRLRAEHTRRFFRQGFQLMADRDLLAPGVDAEYAARSTFAIWDGIQVHWLIEPDAVSVTDTLRTHLGLITTMSDFSPSRP